MSVNILEYTSNIFCCRPNRRATQLLGKPMEAPDQTNGGATVLDAFMLSHMRTETNGFENTWEYLRPLGYSMISHVSR